MEKWEINLNIKKLDSLDGWTAFVFTNLAESKEIAALRAEPNSLTEGERKTKLACVYLATVAAKLFVKGGKMNGFKTVE